MILLLQNEEEMQRKPQRAADSAPDQPELLKAIRKKCLKTA